MSNSVIIMCSARRYSFEGWTFDDESMGGSPWPLKKNGDPRERAGRQFYQMFDRFKCLTKKEKKKHLLGGGCEFINLPKVRKA